MDHSHRHWDTQERVIPETIDAHAHAIDAKANLLREERLTEKYDRDQAIGREAARMETGRTQDALGKLGAGKSYGA